MSRCHMLAWASLLALTIASGPVSPALASDGTAELAAGGLAFAASPSIKIEQQDVLIARDRIAITYTLLNKSDTPVSIHMAFPLPDLDAAVVNEEEVQIPAVDQANFVQSQTTIDGQPITPKIEQRALSLGIDATAQLRELGVDLFPFTAGNAVKLDGLTPEMKLELLERGILKDEGGILAPAWTVKTVAHWRQAFQPRQKITIVHSYRPVASLTPRNQDAIVAHRKRSCLTPQQESAIAALPSEGGIQPTMMTIGYGVTPSADALGSVGRFRLIVESSDAVTVVASCRDGLRRTGPMQLEWGANDFTHDEEFHVLMVR